MLRFIDTACITSTFVITNTGDVGIGSTLPQSGLDVIKSTLIQGALNVTGIGTFENNVYIKADDKNFKIQKEDGTETYIETTANQDVKLFFNGVEKMATTVDGVNVLGTLTAQLIDGGSY